MKRTTRFDRVMDVYAEHTGLKNGTFCFSWENQRLENKTRNIFSNSFCFIFELILILELILRLCGEVSLSDYYVQLQGLIMRFYLHPSITTSELPRGCEWHLQLTLLSRQAYLILMILFPIAEDDRWRLCWGRDNMGSSSTYLQILPSSWFHSALALFVDRRPAPFAQHGINKQSVHSWLFSLFKIWL